MERKSQIAWRDDLIRDQDEVISELKEELKRICSIKEAEISELLSKIKRFTKEMDRLSEEVGKSQDELNKESIAHTETKGRLKMTELIVEDKDRVITQLIKECESITIWSIIFKPNKKYLWKQLRTQTHKQ